MKALFFLVPFFLVASFGIYEASALETITTEHNFDTDNGDGTRTVRTHHPYVFDGNNWVPFIASGTQVQTHMGSVTLNGTGYFQWNGKFNDSIKAKYADISDLNTWTYPNTLNNDTPDISWDGSQLVSEKNKAGVGNLKYKYVFDNGKWKTQLEATNLSALNTKVFGFDQTINLNSDTIKFGGIIRNLDNFDGQTFDKEFLINNEGKVLDLLNGIAFDFDLGFENLHSITVHDTGENKSQLVFDYRTSEILLPGETLIIDPTFNSGASTDDGVIFSTATTGAACSTTYGGITTTADRNVKRDNSSNDDCQASYFNFDISGAGNVTSVSSATIEFDIVTSTSPLNCDFIHRATVFQGDQASWTALLSYTGATVVKNNDATCASGVADGYVVTFDSNIYPLIVTDANSDGTVSIGVGFDNWARDATTHRFDFRNNDAVLEFVYTTNAFPDSITDLTADTIGTTTAELSFTAPDMHGETLLNYMLNVTTPQQDTPPTTFWMNSTSSPFNVVGLTPGTEYSASASAYNTAGLGNWTLANVLNFTTYELPDGSVSMTTGNIGDTLKVESTVTLTASEPLPATAEALKLYQDNVLVKTDVISESIVAIGVPVALDNLWYRITDGNAHEYALFVSVRNDGGTSDIAPVSNSTVTREYNPSYANAIDNPATQGLVNATVDRFDDDDGINLKVNRLDVLTGDTWQIECIAQTNTQAAASKDPAESWEGIWSNTTDTGYFNTTFTGFENSHAYITCLNEDLLFTLTDFTDSSLALLGIQLFDDSYGAMLGVPVGVFFLVMTAGMANKRTAPTFIIVITGIAGTMATIGFFTFEPLVWGLALVTAMLGIFVNQKIF